MSDTAVAKALADSAAHRAREAAGLEVTVERKKTDRYRIEERTVFIVCHEKEPPPQPHFLRRNVVLVGDSWTENDEEVFACDTLEGARDAMKRLAERAW